METSEWVRPADACKLLGCGRSFLFKLTRRGVLHPSRPSKRLTLYRRAEVERFIESNCEQAA